MYRCEHCGNTSVSGEKMNKQTTSTRVVTYPERTYYVRGRKIVDPGGEGNQIAKEEARCCFCVGK